MPAHQSTGTTQHTTTQQTNVSRRVVLVSHHTPQPAPYQKAKLQLPM